MQNKKPHLTRCFDAETARWDVEIWLLPLSPQCTQQHFSRAQTVVGQSPSSALLQLSLMNILMGVV